MTGEMVSSTIKLIGQMEDTELDILFDRGSTHCFLKTAVTENFIDQFEAHRPFKVRASDGKELVCSNWIPKMRWSMQSIPLSRMCTSWIWNHMT